MSWISDAIRQPLVLALEGVAAMTTADAEPSDALRVAVLGAGTGRLSGGRFWPPSAGWM